MRAAIACAGLLVHAAASDAKCARVELAPAVLTPAKATLPEDGGVLVGWTSSTDAEKSDADPSMQPKWHAIGENRGRVELTMENLAPGLSVYRTTAKQGFGILDDKARSLGTFSRGGATKLDLPAPAPTSVVLSSTDGFRGGKEHEIDATFASVPPAAVALIIYRLSGGKRVALSFAKVEGKKSIPVYADPGHCGWNPPGTTLADPKDSLELAWVDAFGRASPSAPIALQIKH